MKRIVSLLLCVLLLVTTALPAAAAKKEPRVSKIVRCVDGGYTETQTFSYDEKNRLSQVEIWDYGHDEPVRYLVTYAYDKKGNVKKITNGWDDGTGEAYCFAHKYNEKNQIAKTTTKMVALSPTEEDYTIWEDTTTFKYDKSNRLVKKTRDYYGTIITTTYEYGNGYIVATELAESEGEEINCITSYYEPNTAPLSISFTEDEEYIVCHEMLANVMGMYLDNCVYEWDGQGRIVYIYETDGNQEIEITYEE